MIKVAHIGAYDKNIGDNIAIYNVRKYVDKSCSKTIEWSKIDVKEFHEHNNNPSYCVDRFKKINEDYDAIVIGGGGLIQRQPKYENKFNLPFHDRVFEVLKIPIICCSVGYNTFRVPTNLIESTGDLIDQHIRDAEDIKFIENLTLLIEKSSFFSVRDDGSASFLRDILIHNKDKLRNLGLNLPTRINKTPDPGLIFDKEKERKRTLTSGRGVLQPSANGNINIMHGRFRGILNMSILNQIKEQNDLKVFPHCDKDYILTLKPHFAWANTLDKGRYQQRGLTESEYIKSIEDELYRATPEYNIFLKQGVFVEEDYCFPKKYFIENLSFENFNTILEEYFQVDYSIAMRGHGSIIATGLNIPHINFSTQNKVYYFGVNNGFREYTVDTYEPFLEQGPSSSTIPNIHQTKDLVNLKTKYLTENEDYLQNWYCIRDSYVKSAKNVFFNMCNNVSKILEYS